MVKIVSDRIQPMAGSPNFTGYSRGAKPDLSMKVGMEGMAGILDMFTGMMEQKNLGEISNQLDNVIIKGLDQPVQQEPGPTSILPPNAERDIGQTVNSLSSVQRSYNQGRVSQSFYWMNVLSGVKQLKTKYPQYADQIDEMVKRKLGVAPAKEYIKSVFKEQDDAIKQERKERQDVENLIQKYAHPEEVDNLLKASQDPQQREFIKVEMMRRAARSSDIERRAAELELSLKQGRVDERRAEQLADVMVGDTMKRFYNMGFAQLSGGALPDYNNINEWINDILKDKRVSPEEAAQIRQVLPRFRSTYSQMLTQQFYQPLPGKDITLAQLLGPEKTKKMIDSALQTFDSLIAQPLTNGDYGALGYNAKMLEDIQNSDTLKVMSTNEMARKLSVAKNIIGEKGMQTLLGTSGVDAKKFFDSISKTELDVLKMDAVSKPEKGLIGHVKDFRMTNEKDKPQAIRSFVKDTVNTFTSPETDNKARAVLSELLYGEGNQNMLSSIAQKDRIQVFKRMVNDEALRSVQQTAKEKPEVLRKYSHWVQSNFINLFKQEMDNVREFVNLKGEGDKPVGGLAFDPKTGTFSIQWSDPANVGENVTFVESWRAKDAAESVARLNEMLPHVRKALEAAGEDPNTYFKALFKDLTKGAGTEKAFDRMVGDWIRGLLSGDKKEEATKPTGETPVNPDNIFPPEAANIKDQALNEPPGFGPAGDLGEKRIKDRLPEDENVSVDKLATVEQKSTGTEAYMNEKQANPPQPVAPPKELFDKLDAINDPKAEEVKKELERLFNVPKPVPRPENLDTTTGSVEKVKGGYRVGNVILIPNSRTHNVDFENTKPEVLTKLSRAAEMAGLKSLKINSAYRDPETNKRIGGARKSRHLRGDAIDISVRGMSTQERKRLIESLIAAGFKGIGVYRTAIHADLGGKRTWGPSYHSDSVPKWARAVLRKHGYGV